MDPGVQHRVAVHPDVDLRAWPPTATRPLVVAEPLLAAALGEGWTVERPVTGADMERWTYQRRSSWSSSRPIEEGRPTRTSSCSPTTSPPRTAPGWCTSRPRSARTTSRSAAPTALPVVNPVGRDGHFDDDVPLVGGQFFKHADADLVARPRRTRACCSGTCPTSTATRTAGAATPRCMYYAQPSWYVRTTADQGRPARARTRRPTGTRRRSSTAATATG